MATIITFNTLKKFKPGKTSMKDMLPHLESNRGATVLSLNVIDKDNTLVMSNTITFAHVNEDEINPGFYLIESGEKIEATISEQSMDKYILNRIENNGLHLVYAYYL